MKRISVYSVLFCSCIFIGLTLKGMDLTIDDFAFVTICTTAGSAVAFGCAKQISLTGRRKAPQRIPVSFSKAGETKAPVPETTSAPDVPNVFHEDYSDCSVLIVDDMPMNLQVLNAMFRNYKVRTLTAGSAREALQILQHSKIDLLLTDLHMPEMNGAEFARILRKTDRCPRFGIVAFTGDSNCGREFDLSLFDEVYLKPISLNRISVLMEKHVRSKKQLMNRE